MENATEDPSADSFFGPQICSHSFCALAEERDVRPFIRHRGWLQQPRYDRESRLLSSRLRRERQIEQFGRMEREET